MKHLKKNGKEIGLFFFLTIVRSDNALYSNCIKVTKSHTISFLQQVLKN